LKRNNIFFDGKLANLKEVVVNIKQTSWV